jgi:hypothetical protein
VRSLRSSPLLNQLAFRLLSLRLIRVVSLPRSPPIPRRSPRDNLCCLPVSQACSPAHFLRHSQVSSHRVHPPLSPAASHQGNHQVSLLTGLHRSQLTVPQVSLLHSLRVGRVTSRACVPRFNPVRNLLFNLRDNHRVNRQQDHQGTQADSLQDNPLDSPQVDLPGTSPWWEHYLETPL